jgi:aryl-alcohol dehydrogenase-like predicted oxidoreductase
VNDKDKTGGQTLWHGRFEQGPSPELLAFSESLSFDRRLAADDINGSRAHVRGLQRGDILTQEEADAILAALDQVAKDKKAKCSQVALAWLMSRPAITAPICSATTVAQLRELMSAAELVLDEQALSLLDHASAG